MTGWLDMGYSLKKEDVNVPPVPLLRKHRRGQNPLCLDLQKTSGKNADGIKRD